MKPYVTLHKEVGQTPLDVVEAYKKEHKELVHVPMAYAGRLDPMASGKLLVLMGDECKVQETYHHLDKEYIFEILLGASSDTGDVLGLIHTSQELVAVTKKQVEDVAKTLEGPIELPYPHFSSKTVAGKPLHVWKLEGRINEIDIPTKKSEIYKLDITSIETQTRDMVYTYATQKIETIPKVTDTRKSLGNDFRREDVRNTWKNFLHTSNATYQVLQLRCICSSGTYMRTLAEVIASKLKTQGLAYSITRTKIGKYKKLPLRLGFWIQKF